MYGKRRRIYEWLSPKVLFVHGGVAVLVSAYSAAGKVDQAEWAKKYEVVGDVLGWMQSTAWYMIPLLVLLSTITEGLHRYLKSNWVWDPVHRLLDAFRDRCFSHLDGGDTHHHRVTLFKLHRGHLVPVERSGHATQKTRTRFRAPDDADGAEGIAGKTWARGGEVIQISSLPELTRDSSSSEKEEYARDTFVSTEWVDARLKLGRALARSYCGIPVEVKGKIWGVIVLDSRSERGTSRHRNADYHLVGRILAILLERV